MPTDFTVIGTYQGFTDTGTTLHISDVATIETDGSYIAEDTPVASGHIFYKLFYIADGKTVTVANNATVHGIGEAPAAVRLDQAQAIHLEHLANYFTSEIYRGLFMASRTSTVVAKGKGGLIYHNSSSTAQLVTINAVAQDGVSNPKIGVVLSNSATEPLNQQVLQYTLGATVHAKIMDIDVTNGGQADNLVSNTQHGASNMGDKDGNVYKSSASSESSHHYVDPWFWVKPSDYGNATDDKGALLATKQQLSGAMG